MYKIRGPLCLFFVRLREGSLKKIYLECVLRGLVLIFSKVLCMFYFKYNKMDRKLLREGDGICGIYLPDYS